jgi:5-methylcytosine-specific restriction protein A
MNYKDLSDRNTVLKAIAECDLMGRDAFLVRYGFKNARKFELIYEGKSYDSKAIVGIAFGYQFGTPLSSSDFSGGKNTVVPLLENLGFEVAQIADFKS